MHSCIYEGTVRHRRFKPLRHEFEYRIFLLFLDLDEIDELFEGRWLWSVERPNVASFRRRNYLGDPDVPLKTAVLDRVEERTGRRPEGPVRLLTHLSYLGYTFNPVSFYYCYDRGGQNLEAIVAEITNTPWNERHAYVLDTGRSGAGGKLRKFSFAKTFHVSPFMGMDVVYDWRLSEPGDRLAIHMINRQEDQPALDASLVLSRRPVSGRSLASVLLRFPLMTVRVITAIYWQALKLWMKKCPSYEHPSIGNLEPRGSRD